MDARELDRLARMMAAGATRRTTLKALASCIAGGLFGAFAGGVRGNRMAGGQGTSSTCGDAFIEPEVFSVPPAAGLVTISFDPSVVSQLECAEATATGLLREFVAARQEWLDAAVEGAFDLGCVFKRATRAGWQRG